MLRALILLTTIVGCVKTQSNYDEQSNSIEYNGQGLPESTILDGKITKLDDISPIIFLNRTKAALNCAAGFMQIDLKFENSFLGTVYAEFDKDSVCTIFGNGNKTARIELPLKGCGTIQNPTRVFTNNIVVRFHPGLEMDSDEVITIVCRYPPPIAPPPALPSPIRGPLLPSVQEIPLKGFQILLIICAILFLSLVLLGLAASYYCLRNRRIQLIRRHPIHGAESEISPVSESSSGNLSMYEGLKIPRAQAQVTTTASVSESEVAILSGVETIASDYPSESFSITHSEVEELDARSLRRSLSSSGSYENKSFVQQNSYFSEQHSQLSETEISRHRAPPPEPKFNVEMRVKKAPPPPPTSSASSSDTEGSGILQDRNLTTIQESDERMEMNSFQYKADIHRPPKAKSPPVYSEVVRKNMERTEDIFEQKESDYNHSEMSTEMRKPPGIARKPEKTSHYVDDVFLRTITEKKTIEDIEKHRRQVTEYHARLPPTPTRWDVEIRNYPNPNAPPSDDDSSTTDWDTHSENSSIYGVPPSRISQFHSGQTSSEQYRSTLDIPVPNPPPANWDSLVRVLEYPEEGDKSAEMYLSEQTLTVEDKKKWRKIITTESMLRTLLTEATVREDYDRIRRDHKYERLFEPEKWDVIMRVLTPEDRFLDQKAAAVSNKYRKKSEWEARSKRNSLPTLYEYDSDGSSIHAKKMDSVITNTFYPIGPSRRTSRSSMKSDLDVRSMSETVVDFTRHDMADNMSDASSYYRRSAFYDDDDDEGTLVRSLSQPSLASNSSEFTESWGMRRGWNTENSQQSPRSSMRTEEDGTTTSYSINKSSYSRKKWMTDGRN